MDRIDIYIASATEEGLEALQLLAADVSLVVTIAEPSSSEREEHSAEAASAELVTVSATSLSTSVFQPELGSDVQIVDAPTVQLAPVAPASNVRSSAFPWPFAIGVTAGGILVVAALVWGGKVMAERRRQHDLQRQAFLAHMVKQQGQQTANKHRGRDGDLGVC
jgi:hypothetical protein